MQLSAFSILDSYPEFDGRGRDRHREAIRLAEIAENSGFRAFWAAEHHFHEGGVCPSPPVLLAAAGARTRRLRLGAMVSVLPFHPPLEVAEQYGMLDRLLEGRLDLGVGSGYLRSELEGFGVTDAIKRERFDRNLEAVLSAFRGEAIGAGGSGPVRTNVRPVQQPHPPLWIAVQRREAIPFVARRGANLGLVPYATLAGVDELQEEIREYRAALPEGHRGFVSAAMHLYAGPNPGSARRALKRFLDSRKGAEGGHFAEKVRNDPAHASPESLEAAGWAAIGSFAEVESRLEAYRAAGVDEVLGIVDFGALEFSEVSESVERLGAYARGRSPDP